MQQDPRQECGDLPQLIGLTVARQTKRSMPTPKKKPPEFLQGVFKGFKSEQVLDPHQIRTCGTWTGDTGSV
jgi:hypothetical protein